MSTIRVAFVVALVNSAVGCSSNDGTPSSQSGSGGATPTTSPSTALGGQSPSGVVGGSANASATSTMATNSGGSTANGTDAQSLGGTSMASGGSNVSLATGGSRASGGTSMTTPTGGVNSQGGAATKATGGAIARGGAATGGRAATQTGGASGKAGAATTATGGAVSAGGTTTTATGGASSAGATTTATGKSTGCGKSGTATGVQNLTMPIAGTDRSYVLSVPTNYDPNTALPLVFAWHGLGGTGTMARQYFGIEKAAGNQAIFVYPSGLLNAEGQAGWTLTQDGIDVQFFDALLADVTSNYCVDRSRVFSTGHSFGAMMTNALGCFRANVLRGVAPVAGMPPFGRATCAGAVAAWIAHGDNDATVDFTTGGIASRDFWIKLDGCSATTDPIAVDPTPCVAYQACSDGHPVHWCVHQSNHNWPSFAAAGIWAFFNALK